MGFANKLEELANRYLENDFQDRTKSKSKRKEYPVLSPQQLKRRHQMEIPYSSLSYKQQMNLVRLNIEF